MKKLNNRGYLLVEIIVAIVLGLAIAYYLMNLTIKFSEKNEDVYKSITWTNDKNLLTNAIMEDIEEYGLIAANYDEESNVVSLKYDDPNVGENGVKKLVIYNNDNIIEYGDYKKKLDSVLKIGDIKIEIKEDAGKDYTVIDIPVTSLYSNEDYGLTLFVPYLVKNYTDPVCVVDVSGSGNRFNGGWNWGNYLNYASWWQNGMNNHAMGGAVGAVGAWGNSWWTEYYKNLYGNNWWSGANGSNNVAEQCEEEVTYHRNMFGITYIVRYKIMDMSANVEIFGDKNFKFVFENGVFKVISDDKEEVIDGGLQSNKEYVFAFVLNFDWFSAGGISYDIYNCSAGVDGSCNIKNKKLFEWFGGNQGFEENSSTSGSDFIVNDGGNDKVKVTDAIYYFKALNSDQIVNNFVKTSVIDFNNVSAELKRPLFYYINH